MAVFVDHAGRGGSLLIRNSPTEGATVESSDARNPLPLEPSHAHRLIAGGIGVTPLIAGGIGVTPLIAMCRRADVTGADWSLAYLRHSKETLPYLDDLVGEFGCKVRALVSTKGSRYDVDAAVATMPDAALVYCCGPERLMSAVEETMEAAGRIVNVRLERFKPERLASDIVDEAFVV